VPLTRKASPVDLGTLVKPRITETSHLGHLKLLSNIFWILPVIPVIHFLPQFAIVAPQYGSISFFSHPDSRHAFWRAGRRLSCQWIQVRR
jgi:hypothetical protein